MAMAKKLPTETLRTWITIDTKAVKHNFQIFRRLIGRRAKLMPIVKSNAYGHGLVPFSKLMVKLGAEYLGVDSIKEALRLRREGIKIPILVLGYTRSANLPLAVRHRITLTISSLESLRDLTRFSKPLLIHLKVDTGMCRQGFTASQWPAALRLIKKLPAMVKIEGLYTHLASASSKLGQANSYRQLAVFRDFVKQLAVVGVEPTELHALATGGTLHYRTPECTMYRVGLGLYGLWPSAEWARRYGRTRSLRPALTWQTLISEVKQVPAGSLVGYDGTEKLRRATTLAICPIGYWHGYPRALSSMGTVLVRGYAARVVGRVSMDIIAIDVTKGPHPRVGETVTIIGPGAPVGPLATLVRTSVYEFITRINPLIKRFYI